jgi:hypothetical protein
MEGWTFHQRSDTPQHSPSGRRHRLSQQRNLTSSRRDEAEQHTDGGGLARAIGAEKAVDCPARNRHVDVIDSNLAPEPLRQPAGEDGLGIGGCRCHLLSAW